MTEEEREAKKNLFLRIGVVSVFAVVFVLWLLNIQGVFSNVSSTESDSKWEETMAEIDKNTKETEDRLGLNTPEQDKTNEFVEKLLDKTEDIASSSISTSSAIIEIKKELSELVVTSTAPVVNNNCPPYINCMPSIGEARPCVIPPGCENITQIAY